MRYFLPLVLILSIFMSSSILASDTQKVNTKSSIVIQSRELYVPTITLDIMYDSQTGRYMYVDDKGNYMGDLRIQFFRDLSGKLYGGDYIFYNYNLGIWLLSPNTPSLDVDSIGRLIDGKWVKGSLRPMTKEELIRYRFSVGE